MTPKQYALAMAVRHIIGSSTLIRLLNGRGHSMSYSSVLSHDTSLSDIQIQQGIVPEGMYLNCMGQH